MLLWIMHNIATPLKIEHFARTHNKILSNCIEHHAVYSSPLEYMSTFLILYQDRNDYKQRH